MDVMGNEWAYWFALISVFTMAVLIEGLDVLMNRMEARAKYVMKHRREPQTVTRAWMTLVFMFKMFFAYFLMLSAMTFNACIVLAICLGFSFGYFVFGFEDMTFETGSKVVDSEAIDRTKTAAFGGELAIAPSDASQLNQLSESLNKFS